MSRLDQLSQQVQEHLQSGEKILASVQGQFETKRLGADSIKTGAMFATNQRLVFFAKRLFGYDLEHFPYKNISSFEMGKKFLGHYIRFYASGNEVKLKWIQHGDVNLFAEIVRDSMNSSSMGTAVVVPVSPAANGDHLRFRVHGAERDTGEECVFELRAATVQEARAKANAAGYLVNRVELLG